MSLQARVLQAFAVAWVALACGWSMYRLFAVRPEPVPSLGSRGNRRQQALERSATFRFFEPMARQVGAWSASLPIAVLRTAIERRLAESGYYLGVTADEFIGLQAVSGIAYGALGYALGIFLDARIVASVIGAVLAPSLLHQELSAQRERRFREVARSLPVAIDLAAMCMHAGLDFPGAIRLIIESPHRGQQVLHEELLRVLQELDLGHTRAEALRSFAERVPSPAVREFVAAAIQAEAKGTPLSEVLRIQATMLRMQRTVLAEEAAARAAILMALPLIMLLCSLLIMLLGALVIKSFDSEIWS